MIRWKGVGKVDGLTLERSRRRAGSLGRIQQSGRDSGRQEAADDEDGRWRLIDGGVAGRRRREVWSR
jgi:hypothetical protein